MIVAKFFAAIAVALLLAGCQTIDGGTVIRNAVEAFARAGCQAASNCTNTCPDGGEARGPLYRCPATRRH